MTSHDTELKTSPGIPNSSEANVIVTLDFEVTEDACNTNVEDGWLGEATEAKTAARLVACWNACRGITTDSLGRRAKERDELIRIIDDAADRLVNLHALLSRELKAHVRSLRS